MFIIMYKNNAGEIGVTKLKASHIIEAAQFFTKQFLDLEILQITLCN